ncbi:MAG: hypothetical protein DI537_45530 [Stutzerimonas stutzeri]|nr:MAG: hypothetical protein DI537_45530 [Stutzerimonas stutzeri]
MFSNNVSLTVVINGNNGEHPAREFVSPIDRQTYVEGREGSNFTLRLRNSNNFRVLAIPAVDGLSVLDGKPAGEKSPGYILEANQTLDIPGWVVDSGTAAKFFFAGMKADGGDASYVGESGGDTLNKGFIGLKVFKEEYTYTRPVLRSFTTSYPANGAATLMSARGISKGIAPMGGTAGDPWGGAATFNNVTTSMVGGLESVAMAASTSFTTDSFEQEEKTSGGIIQQTLGTGFGEATDFATTKSEFKRGDLLAMMVIKYDDRRGLKKRGIEVDRPAARAPGSAFPADNTGCTPPAGWTR